MSNTPHNNHDVQIFENLLLIKDGYDQCGESALAIKGDKIFAVGTTDELRHRFPTALRQNYQGYLAMPGLVNAHSHATMSFFRGLGHDHTSEVASDKSMIEDFFFPAEKKLTAELTAPLAYSYLVDGLKSGVTCFADAYFFADGVGKAAEKIGLKAAIGEHHADLGGPLPAGKDLWEKTKKMIESWPFSDDIKPVVYAHAADTMSKDFLTELAHFARSYDLPFHMHLSQTKGERDRVKQREGVSPVEFAESCRALHPRSLLVHLLSADSNDYKIIADSGAIAGLTPTSEIIYESAPSVRDIWDANIPFVLGTDCAASCDGANVLAEGKLLALLLAIQGRRPSGLLQKIFESLTSIPNQLFGFPMTGKISEGYQADIVFLKEDISVVPRSDLLVNLFYSFQSRHVKHVMINGNWVLRDGELVQVAEQELLAEYQAALKEVKKRTGLPIL